MRIFLVVAFAACGSASYPCDSAQLSVSCKNPNGQCVDFTGLSTADQHSASIGCTSRNGTVLSAACDTAGRLGTCVIPANGANTDVTCSPNASIAIRYFAPFSASSAQTACDGVAHSVWTPN